MTTKTHVNRSARLEAARKQSVVTAASTSAPVKPASERHIPLRRYVRQRTGVDQENDAEVIVSALSGIEAISDVIFVNCVEKSEAASGYWSDGFIDQLHCGQMALVRLANEKLDALRNEQWHLHALLGDYGEAAKAKAQRDIDAAAEAQWPKEARP